MRMMALRIGASYAERYLVGDADCVMGALRTLFDLMEVQRDSDGSWSSTDNQEPLAQGIEIVEVREDAAAAMPALRKILALEDDIGRPKTPAGLIAAAAIKKAVGERIAKAAGIGPPPDADDLIPF